MDRRLRDLARRARAEGGAAKDQYIAALERALYGRKFDPDYVWQLDIFGGHGAHWGRGHTPEEALVNAYRMYVGGWHPEEEEPYQAPEEFHWRWRASDGIYYYVSPPEIDFDSILVDFYDRISSVFSDMKQAMAVFGVVDNEALAATVVMDNAFNEWFSAVEGQEDFQPIHAFCYHVNAEAMPQEGPNIAYCPDCRIVFRTDLP